jgi:hypothetical protein
MRITLAETPILRINSPSSLKNMALTSTSTDQQYHWTLGITISAIQHYLCIDGPTKIPHVHEPAKVSTPRRHDHRIFSVLDDSVVYYPFLLFATKFSDQPSCHLFLSNSRGPAWRQQHAIPTFYPSLLFARSLPSEDASSIFFSQIRVQRQRQHAIPFYPSLLFPTRHSMIP